MNLLDSDTVTLLAAGHPRVTERVLSATRVVATTIITRIEVLRGRFEFLLKAADGEQLQRAQHLLEQSDRDLAKLAIMPISAVAASEFDHLKQNKN